MPTQAEFVAKEESLKNEELRLLKALEKVQAKMFTISRVKFCAAPLDATATHRMEMASIAWRGTIREIHVKESAMKF